MAQQQAQQAQQAQQEKTGHWFFGSVDEEEPVRHPPWFLFGLSWTGILLGIAANLWQIVTSVIAFFSIFLIKTQGAAMTGAILISAGMALTFQLGLMFFVFQVHREMLDQKIGGADGMQAARHTAVSMVSQHKLMVIWTLVSFAADTVGDFTFIGMLTNNSFLIFMYAASLYAASTILLSTSLERQWATSVSYQNWKAFILTNELAAEKLRNKRDARDRAQQSRGQEA